jgi:hypothetical protein
MHMQECLGKLTEAVESLKTQSKDPAKELKDVATAVHGLKVGLTVSAAIPSAVFAASAAIIGFIFNHLAEVVQAYITVKK